MKIEVGVYDDHIESVELYIDGINIATVYNGDSYSTSADVSYSVSVEAVAEDGYRFSYWNIYTQSLANDEITSEDNPYYYEEPYDVWIYPYSEVDEQWTRVTDSKTDIGSTTTTIYPDDLAAYETLRLKLTFANTGGAEIDITCSRDVYAWWTGSSPTTIDSATGYPKGYDLSDIEDDSPNGDSATLDIYKNVSAGTTYYLWLRAETSGRSVSDITIKVKGPAASEWTVKSFTVSVEDSDYSGDESYVIDYYMDRYKVTFKNSGTATFYTVGNDDTYGLLTTSSGFDSSTGEPTGTIRAENDDSEDSLNFSFSYDVDAGTTYYVWVKNAVSAEGASYYLVITAPEVSEELWTQTTSSIGTLSSNYSTSSSNLASGYVRRYSVSFSQSGTATFYTTGGNDTYGYLSTSSSFDNENGGPNNILVSDDDAGDSLNFKLTYNVNAGTTYYVWVRGCYYSTSLTDYILHITAPIEEIEWTVNEKNLGTNITSYSSSGESVNTATLNCYKMTFLYSGTATFNTNSYEAYGYLTTTSNFDKETGIPSSPLISNATAGSFSYDGIEAGVTYYYWIRGVDKNSTFTYSVEIIGPVAPSEGIGAYIYDYYSLEWKKVTPYIYKDGWKKASIKIFLDGSWPE